VPRLCRRSSATTGPRSSSSGSSSTATARTSGSRCSTPRPPTTCSRRSGTSSPDAAEARRSPLRGRFSVLRAAPARVPPGRARRGERPPAVDLGAGEGLQGRPPVAEHFIEVIRKAGLVKGKDYDYNKTEKVFSSTGPARVALDGRVPLGRRPAVAARCRPRHPLDRRVGVHPERGRVGRRVPGAHRQARARHHDDDAERQELVLRGVLERRGARPMQFRVEYTSIDNPYFPRRMWEYALKHYHPVMFRRSSWPRSTRWPVSRCRATG
jgi:hypothetical protein